MRVADEKIHLNISDDIITSTMNENVVVMQLDLSSQQSIRNFASAFLKSEKRLDILIHNAGYAGVFRKARSIDGIEMTMATNHYGPFLLTHLLVNLLKRSAPAKIVVVSSKYHHVSTFKPTRSDDFNPVSKSNQSKLENSKKFSQYNHNIMSHS